MPTNKNTHYAVLSGICASTASMCGKLCGLQEFLLLRALFFLLMLLCNAGVCTLFVKALHASDSSLSATVTSAASNYLFTAVIGFFVFGEITTLLWWSGIFLVMSGLVLILRDQVSEEAKKDL